jgi:hypothetical protein
MGSATFQVSPRILHLPPSRLQGADPLKLRRQIAQFGKSMTEMPALEVYQDPAGRLMVWNGVTRATRVAKLIPGATVPVVVIGILRKHFDILPTIEDRLP